MKPSIYVFNYQGAGRGCRSSCWLMGCWPHHELLGSLKRPRNPADVANMHHWPQHKASKQHHSSHNCQTKKISVHNELRWSNSKIFPASREQGVHQQQQDTCSSSRKDGVLSLITYMGDWKRWNCRGGDDQIEWVRDEGRWILRCRQAKWRNLLIQSVAMIRVARHLLRCMSLDDEIVCMQIGSVSWGHTHIRSHLLALGARWSHDPLPSVLPHSYRRRLH